MKKINIPNFLLVIVAFGGIMVSSCGKKEQVVKIENAPGPNFTASAVVIKPGGTVDFTSTSTGDINAYIWSFPGADSSTSRLKDPKGIKYSRPGKHAVSLTTNGPSGSNTVTRQEYIFVNALDLPLTLDAKDSIQTFGGSVFLFKTGTIANLNPDLQYTFQVVHSTKNATPYYNFDQRVTANVTADGKISFAIPLNGKTTNYRLYVMVPGQVEESYSSVSTYTVPAPNFVSGSSVLRVGSTSRFTLKGDVTSSIKFSILDNFYEFGIVWREGSTPATISNSRQILGLSTTTTTPEKGSFNQEVNLSEIGTVNFRFYAKIGDEVVYFEPTSGGTQIIPAFIGFEGGVVPSFWTIGDWNYSSNEAKTGFRSLRNNFISSDGEFSITSFTRTFSTATNLTFWYNATTFASNDKLEVLVNNVPGTNTIAFRVTKSGSFSSPNVYIDDITF
jgi:PKD repeat protein